ncbi:MAG: YceI family protein [Candidatus Acidiferrum sp.]
MKPRRHRKSGYGSWRVLLGIALLTVALSARAAQGLAAAQVNPGEVTLSIDTAQSKLHWTLSSTLHTVHGTFNLKSGVLKYDPASGKASGEIVVYATSGESGNEGRDKKMHGEILESQRYPEITFRPDRIEGKAVGQGTCSVQLHGTFVLHGAEHELTVPVQAELAGDHWKGTAKFSVPYIQWGLKSPNTFLLKADPAVDIELEMNGPMQVAAAR